MRDENKKNENIIIRIPGRLFKAFEPDISTHKLLKKIKKLYLFIFLLIFASLTAYGILFHPDITAITYLVLFVTVISWCIITDLFF